MVEIVWATWKSCGRAKGVYMCASRASVNGDAWQDRFCSIVLGDNDDRPIDLTIDE